MQTKLQQKAEKIIAFLSEMYPNSTIALNFNSPFELLVATILSAQCTDKRVNIITEELFQYCRTPQDFARLPLEDLEKAIFSAGFYKNKSKNIKAAAEMILEKFAGEVPDTMEELLELPGVGRKTANVVLGHCFGKPGIVVDTHVGRISRRLGLAKGNTPEKIEFELMEVLPQSEWIRSNHLMIDFGRAICSSQNPKCNECLLSTLCDFRKK